MSDGGCSPWKALFSLRVQVEIMKGNKIRRRRRKQLNGFKVLNTDELKLYLESSHVEKVTLHTVGCIGNVAPLCVVPIFPLQEHFLSVFVIRIIESSIHHKSYKAITIIISNHCFMYSALYFFLNQLTFNAFMLWGFEKLFIKFYALDAYFYT